MVRAVAFVGALVFLPAVAAAQQPCTADARHVVNEIYRHVLERSADRGSDAMVRQLMNGETTVRKIVDFVAKSSEHSQRFLAGGSREANERAVSNLYRHILGRQADPDGLRAHTEGVAASGINAVIDNMISSTEYEQSFGDYGVPGSPGLRYCGPRESQTSRGAARRRPGNGVNRDVDQGNQELFDWTAADFTDIDFNRDGRIASSEWNYDPEMFRRADRNSDGVLSRAEFLAGNVSTDRFTSLDGNGNGRIERNEWDGTPAAFDRLDTNRNNLLSRAEVGGSASVGTNAFASLDVNRDGRLSIEEWNGNRRSFDSQDTNGDGVISAREFTGSPAPTTGR